MTAHDADVVELQKAYGDLVAIDRRPEGTQYSGTLGDGTPVAVIALDRGLTSAVRNPDEFLAVMERASAVRHVALARPLEWGRTETGLLHYARAHLEGGVLTPGAFSAVEVAALGEQLARGLSVAHRAGLQHGAVTPWRIARTRLGEPVLDSFGVFAALTAGGLQPREVAAVLGEDSYDSPEAQRSDVLDDRSDIYSLGATLYVLLTGKPPFGGRTTSFVMATVLSNKDSQESDAAADTATAVIVEALLRAIEHAPEDRWSTANAFANALAAGAAAGEAPADVTRTRGWAKFLAIFRDAWFPARRSRE
jgi:serine/threonine protein kinase